MLEEGDHVRIAIYELVSEMISFAVFSSIFADEGLFLM